MNGSYCSASSFGRDFLPGITAITDGRRTCSGRSCASPSLKYQNSMASTNYSNNIWNVIEAEGSVPEAKTGQSIVYWNEGRSIICCYGRNKDDTFSNEFWRFSIDNHIWESRVIEGVTPRAACGFAIVDSKMYFYGGMAQEGFIQGYHIVDLNTLEVSFPITTGEAPPPCAHPMVAFYDKYLIVWAGDTTGASLSSLHRLNIEENVWEKIPTDIVGRHGACGCIIDKILYIFGASSLMTMLTLDLETFVISSIPTAGNEPPHGSECLTMIPSGNSIIAFETSCFSSETKIFVYDVSKSNWMSNYLPITNDNNCATSPRIVFYISDERKLLALGEETEKSKHPLSELKIGKAISSLNQRIDLLSALRCSK